MAKILEAAPLSAIVPVSVFLVTNTDIMVRCDVQLAKKSLNFGILAGAN